MKNLDKVSLQSDGFNFHTFALRYYPSGREYSKVLQHLKKLSEHDEFYPLKEYGVGKYYCGHFSDQGILLYLTQAEDGRGHVKSIVTCRVNPRRLIEPDCSYIGIMPHDEKSLDLMEDAFTEVMRKARLPEFMDEWELHRLDLCVNLLFPRKKLPRFLIDMLRQGPISGNYQFEGYIPDNCFDPKSHVKHAVKVVPAQKRDSKESIRNSVALVIYDKWAQLEANQLVRKKEKCAKEQQYGILRIELHAESGWLKRHAKDAVSKAPRALITYYANQSKYLICSYLSDIFPDGNYYSKDKLEETINSTYWLKGKVKRRMISIVETLKDGNTYTQALFCCSNKMLSKKQKEKIIENFGKLHINPVPIPRKLKTLYLPTLSAMVSVLDEEDCSDITFKHLKSLDLS